MVHHGVSDKDDLSPHLIKRDTRGVFRRVMISLSGNGLNFATAFFSLTSLWAMFTSLFYVAEILLVLCILAFAIKWVLKGKQLGEIFEGQFKRGNKNKGIIYLGFALADSRELWYSDDKLRAHILCIGTTGSGKSRFLLGLLVQALMVGSGAIMVDGKGDSQIFWILFTMARRVKREQDILAINFLTGGKKGARLSNTTNILKTGSAEQLRSTLVSLMRDSGGDGDQWKGMASTMMGGLLKALVYMRDTGRIYLSIASLRSYLPLKKLVAVAYDDAIPEHFRMPILSYLAELPAFDEDKVLKALADTGNLTEFEFSDTTQSQHGFRSMLFTEILGGLGDVYGHIFGFDIGEINMADVLFNRRILFCILPSLEVDPDGLANLGKLIISSIKSALAPALGTEIEGTHESVIAAKPTKSPVPFFIILDEYKFYAVAGFSLVAAQARSLGVSVCFASQTSDISNISAEDSDNLSGNCSLKIYMKIESTDTSEKAVQRAGEAIVSQSEGSERTGAAFGSTYRDSDRTRTEKQSRINIRDLVKQKAGQAYVLNEDNVVPAQLFYADLTDAPEAQLNKFVMIAQPPQAMLNSFAQQRETWAKFLMKDNALLKELKEKNAALSSKATQVMDFFKMARDHKELPQEAAIIAYGAVSWVDTIRSNETLCSSIQAAHALMIDSAESDGEIEKVLADSIDDLEAAVKNKQVLDPEKTTHLIESLVDDRTEEDKQAAKTKKINSKEFFAAAFSDDVKKSILNKYDNVSSAVLSDNEPEKLTSENSKLNSLVDTLRNYPPQVSATAHTAEEFKAFTSHLVSIKFDDEQ